MLFKTKDWFISILLVVFSNGIYADDYRLPESHIPLHYDIQLTLKNETFNVANANDFDGVVTINIETKDENDTVITLHASSKYITIESITIDNQNVTGNYSINETTETIKITKPEGVSSTFHLAIQYKGKHADDMYGFYKSSYQENGTKYLVTTQFQATHARRAFPCFDEPQFKATFNLTITHPANLTALSNTPGSTTLNTTNGMAQTKFNETTKMSTYLVAFIVSDFNCTKSDSDLSVPHQICSKKSAADLRGWPLEEGPKILKNLISYTDIEYNTTAEKMDQVAIPDFSAGAMENWGLVTYREVYMLWSEKENSNRYKQLISAVIAHEFAHMWFGNLVTTKWWSTTFLNEGFARFFQYFTTDSVHPDWEMPKQFIVEQLQAALAADETISTAALESDCSTPSEVSAKFGTISYNKGASVIRMVEHFMSKDKFQEGIRKYLKDNQASNTEPHMLWSALQTQAGSINMTDTMENWITKSGFPLVTATLNGTKVTLTQKRFLATEKETAPTTWKIPITYTISSQNDFENTSVKDWLNDALEIDLPAENFIVLNNQAIGYYRVNYNEELWNRIADALLAENFSKIPDVQRAQIVDDAFNLARIGEIEYSTLFRIIEFLKNDVSYYPWYSAFNGFSYLIRRVDLESELGKLISADIQKWMKKLSEDVPISKLNNTDHIYTIKQALSLSWDCKLGNENCVDEVRKLFNEYKVNGTRPDPNLRPIVYCNVLRFDNKESDWDFLWKKYQETTDATERIILISSLGCIQNETVLETYLTHSINQTSGIRSQDASSVFSSVYTDNSVGVNVAFEFLINNYTKIQDRYQSMNALGNLIRGVAERFTTQEQVDKLTTFTSTLNDTVSTFKKACEDAKNVAVTNIEWTTKLKEQLNKHYDAGKDNAVSNFVSLPVIVISFVIIQFYNYI